MSNPNSAEGSFGAGLDVAIDLPLAGAGSRGLARIIDVLILFAVQLVVGGLLAGLLIAAVTAGGSGATLIGLAIGAWMLVLFLVQWSFLTFLELRGRGQTPGKRLLGLRVVRDDGGELTLVAALLRNLLRLDLLPAGGVIDLALMGWRRDGQRLGDLAAGTVVVMDPPSPVARTWSPALSAPEVSLLETWFDRAPELTAERREVVAARILARLSTRHPDLLATGSAVLALEQLAPRAE